MIESNTNARTDNLAENDQSSISELYHENSKQQRYDREFGRRISAINNNPDIHRLITQAFKTYSGAMVVTLPKVVAEKGLSFEQVVVQRRSIRNFTGEPLSLTEVSKLLYFGNGITSWLAPSPQGIIQPVRAAPSGGALYPVELYPVIFTGIEIETGIYHYCVDKHSLELLQAGQFNHPLGHATSYSTIFAKASMTIILTSMFGRTKFKYSERGYRFALLEAGHIAQNILLAATALGLGAVAIGGFIDDEINEMLDLDGVDESSLYLITIGRPAPFDDETTLLGDRSTLDALLSLLWTPGGLSNNSTNIALESNSSNT